MVNSTEPSPPAGRAATFATMPELGGDDVEEGAINDAACDGSAGDDAAGDDADGDVASGDGGNSSAAPCGRPNVACLRSLGGDDVEEGAIPDGAIAIDDPAGAAGGDAVVDAPAGDETNKEENNPLEEPRGRGRTPEIRANFAPDSVCSAGKRALTRGLYMQFNDWFLEEGLAEGAFAAMFAELTCATGYRADRIGQMTAQLFNGKPSYQSKRFGNVVKRICLRHRDVIEQEFGFDIADIGVHSWRQFALTS